MRGPSASRSAQRTRMLHVSRRRLATRLLLADLAHLDVEHGQRVLDQRDVEVFLRPEVQVDRPDRQLRGAGDQLDRGAGIPALGEHGASRLLDAAATGLPLLRLAFLSVRHGGRCSLDDAADQATRCSRSLLRGFLGLAILLNPGTSPGSVRSESRSEDPTKAAQLSTSERRNPSAEARSPKPEARPQSPSSASENSGRATPGPRARPARPRSHLRGSPSPPDTSSTPRNAASRSLRSPRDPQLAQPQRLAAAARRPSSGRCSPRRCRALHRLARRHRARPRRDAAWRPGRAGSPAIGRFGSSTEPSSCSIARNTWNIELGGRAAP